MNSTNTTLTKNYSNFTFNSENYTPIKPFVHILLNFFYKHQIKKPTLEDCFQTSMTLFQTKLDLETIKHITNYTYYLTSNYPDILN